MLRSGGGAVRQVAMHWELDRRWDALLICLACLLLTSIGRVHQLFPALSPLKPAFVSGGLAVLLCLVDRSSLRRHAGLHFAPTRYLLGLAAWMALSVPGALWQGGAFATWLDFVKTMLTYLLIICAVRGPRDVERLVLAYFVAAVVFSLVILTRFQVGQEGRLADLYYYDANDFATLAVTAIPLGIYFAFARTRLFRALSWCGIAALAVGFVWSGSRGGLLALFAVVAYVLVRYSSIPKRWRIGSLAIITLLAVGTASESYWTRMATILSPKDDYNLTGEEGRIQIWRRGMGYMLANPVVGVGAGNFSTAEGTISPLARRRERGRGVRWAAPHNTYLQVGAELGIPGLVIFGGFFLAVFTTLRTVRRRAAGLADGGRIITLAQSLTAALVGYAVGGFFLSLAYHDMLYALCGIAVALWRVVSRATPTRALTEAPAAPSTGMVTVIRAPA